jgi:hypothetical protein
MSGQGFPSLPTSLPFREEALRRIAQAVNGLLQGKSNNVGTVTCTPGATSTVVTDSRIGANSTMPLDARSASAAAELGAGTAWWSSQGKGTATLTHANAVSADRIFRFAIIG